MTVKRPDLTSPKQIHRRSRRYGWEDMADGDVWLMYAGEDFDDIESARSAGQQWAKRRGYIFKTQAEGLNLAIQFVKE